MAYENKQKLIEQLKNIRHGESDIDITISATSGKVIITNQKIIDKVVKNLIYILESTK